MRVDLDYSAVDAQATGRKAEADTRDRRIVRPRVVAFGTDRRVPWNPATLNTPNAFLIGDLYQKFQVYGRTVPE